MLRLGNLLAPLSFDPENLQRLIAAALGVAESRVRAPRIAKKSVDARRRDDVHFVLTLDFELAPGPAPKCTGGASLSELKDAPYAYKKTAPRPHRPLVVGLGPAGLMAALVLAEAGLCPLVLERGRDVDRRQADVARFFQTGALDPRSNVQFGEGGAGTFSDGKLTTGIKDPRCGEVLRVFYAHGAPESVLFESKPHIGTDNLPKMVRSIRERIIALGGEVRFETALDALVAEQGRVTGASFSGETVDVDDVILAVGHSARDTLAMLSGLGVPMRQKPFSIGVRIEHPQPLIDRAQYGAAANHPALGAADYKLSVQLKSGRGVYTFCMCPGGQVVAAASEPGHLVVNGMSAYARDGRNANAALLVSVLPQDFPDASPLAGLRFQEEWEMRAFELGGCAFRAPAQTVGDFLVGRASKGPGEVEPTYRPGVTWTDLSRALPGFALDSLREAIPLMDRRLRGFALKGAALTGVETRSSSPVTIPRDAASCMSALSGLYPCGEGAGHAGGIMSAAVDGMRCAEAVIDRYEVTVAGM